MQDQIAGSVLNAQAQYNQSQMVPTLERLTNQIQSCTGRVRAIGEKLGEHADRVHGAVPQAMHSTQAAPPRCGALGSLEDAIDDLEVALLQTAEQASRNCTFA